MSEVGIRELKNRLSEYLRKVKEGDVIYVTDRGQTVAELRPPTPGGEGAVRNPGLSDLVQRGLLRPATQINHAALYPVPAPVAAPIPAPASARFGEQGLAAWLLDEERGPE